MIIGFNLIAEYNEKGAGTTTYMKRLFQEMGNSYDLSDHKFIIYKQKSISEEYWNIPKSLNVEFVNVPNLGAGMKRVLFEQTIFYKYLKPCDVLYSNCTSLPLFAKCKKVYTQHDVYFLHDKKSYGLVKRLYRGFIVGLYVKCCHKILTVSQYSKDQILKAYNIPASKIDITYNFNVNNKLSPIIELNKLTDNIGSIHNIPTKFFLYVGRLQHNKNIERMVLGFEMFLSQTDTNDTKLIIVGEPAYKGDNIIDFLKQRKNVIYLGYADDNTVRFLQNRCLAVVLLSLYEGFGIPIIEGFANNKICLTSNTSSLPEVAGNAGVLVNPYNIESIAKGFVSVISEMDTLQKHIPEQINKFSASKATEVFMDSLGLSYKKKLQ